MRDGIPHEDDVVAMLFGGFAFFFMAFEPVVAVVFDFRLRRAGTFWRKCLDMMDFAWNRNGGCKRRIFDFHVVGEQLRILRVSFEHIEMGGNGEAWANGSREIGGFLEGHVADAVAAEAASVTTIDGKHDGVERTEAAEAFEHTFIDASVSRMVDSDAVAFDDIAQIRVIARLRIAIKKFMGGRNGGDFDVADRDGCAVREADEAVCVNFRRLLDLRENVCGNDEF